MKNRLNGVMGFFLINVYVAYMGGILSGSELWANILSPLCALTVTLIIGVSLRFIQNFRLPWLLMGAASFVWALAEALWAILEAFYGMDPESMPFFMVLYILPNVFIAASLGRYFYERFSQWRNIHMLINLFATLTMFAAATWMLFYRQEFAQIMTMDTEAVSLGIYVVLDMLSIALVVVMYLSTPLKRLEGAFVPVISGVLIYSFFDLYYTYQVINDLYIPNSLVDGAFMLGFVLFAYGALLESVDPVLSYGMKTVPASPTDKPTSRGIGLLLVPLMLVFIKGFRFSEVVILVFIAVAYQLLSVYVKNAQRTAEFLKMEIELNNRLEDRLTAGTLDLRIANKNLEKLAREDDVTGLFNRRYFMEALEKRMDAASGDEAVVVVFMDLNRFKAVNDAYGHDMGDAVLKEIAQRLRGWVRKDMLLARMGGDEFVVSFTGNESRAQVLDMVREVAQLINLPVAVEPYQFHVSASIGISQYPTDALDKFTLMKHADIAMYQAKDQAGERITFYTSSLSDGVRRRHELEMLLKRTDYDEEFTLFFQPQFRIADQQITGAEALLRWNSPIRGFVSPGDFIPIAEETGDIVAIGQWVLKNAIRQMVQWNRQYNRTLKIGVNVSPKQLDSLDFIGDLRRVMEEYDADPSWLDIEITESSTMNSEVKMEEILTVFTGMGVSVSIDDFGTGYSSLSYIKRFDIDRLKIARELVSQIETDPVDEQITRAVVMMAKGMELSTIAEGVETEAQLAKLTELGCDEVQGYLTGRPVPAAEFQRLYLDR